MRGAYRFFKLWQCDSIRYSINVPGHKKKLSIINNAHSREARKSVTKAHKKVSDPNAHYSFQKRNHARGLQKTPQHTQKAFKMFCLNCLLCTTSFDQTKVPAF